MNTRFRTHLSGASSYKSFIPSEIKDYDLDISPYMLVKLDNAGRVFDELNSCLQTLGDDGIKQLFGLEAQDSWRLAADTTSNPFALGFAFSNPNIDAIVNATEYGVEALSELPISGRLIRNLHYLICQGSDYDKKYRGEFRRSPVWIGQKGAGLSDAAFIPPVGEDMDKAMDDLDRYINYSDDNALVKAAVAHYQFEMIHPFIDANGRVGRLLDTLLLCQSGILPQPVLLLSHIIARDYNDYCERLQYVNMTSDIEMWLGYWIEILRQSAEYTIHTLNFRHL